MSRYTAQNLQSAMRWGRQRLVALTRHRRGQLLVAVLFGAILGGVFVAAASTGMGRDAPSGRPGFSVVDHWEHPMDHSGYGR